MDFERYTDRAKGFLQAAQGLALREGHQRLTPEHLLKVLLEDKVQSMRGEQFEDVLRFWFPPHLRNDHAAMVSQFE